MTNNVKYYIIINNQFTIKFFQMFDNMKTFFELTIVKQLWKVNKFK